jgi:hypothetical protein
LTLPELVVGITITAIIGLAVAGVSMALSTGHAQSEQYSEYVQSARMGVMRVGRELREASLVTAYDSNTLILWGGDANGDGDINTDELVSISYDASTRQIVKYQKVYPSYWPDWLVDLLNFDLDLDEVDNANSVESYLKYGLLAESTVLATDVRSFDVTTGADAPVSRLVKVRLSVGDSDRALTVNTSMKLRADKTHRVYVSGNRYYLGDN